jgi:hypothetical protein
VRVVVIGMGSRQANLLEMVFAGPGRSCCVVVPEERAQACIIDMDGVGAEEELSRQRRLHPLRPLMLTASRRPPDPVIGSDLFVPKRIGVDALVEAAMALCARAGGSTAVTPEGPPPGLSSPELGSPELCSPGLSSPGLSGPELGSPGLSSPGLSSPEFGSPGLSGPELGSPEFGSPGLGLRGVEVPRQPAAVSPPSRPSASTPRAGDGAERPLGARAEAACDAVGEGSPDLVSDPEGVPAAGVSVYEPARYLQGLVVRARWEALRRDGVVHLEGPWPTITLLPACGTAVVVGGMEALRPFSFQDGLLSNARVTFAPAPLFSPNHPDAVDLEAMLWELALGASAGRVPEGTRPDGPCALRGWPDFARLAPPPGAVSIATLWIGCPTTLEDTARTLRIPLREVCSFYSAAHAVGLITPVAGAVPPAPADHTVAPSPQRGLLRRMFEKLHVA